mmetsp:Transcript_31736/g.67279  ORF Transcript_31736/g.67279 Transcript_31736/m.67279 type:complete len:264 (-) Transcript_31736:122-913(-)|eukprot:CAMPEP_0171331878 /NCGR_PEP_ID=MMETSP0878-20121228/2998_1 /TAXON_ID=67004 /ORGANISM="Thalassiosira weissflogii, Strain CCMP1336" /LENGTH=263 /DNA_ID=CAMNT_0011832521 /DNA_START=119 /DNA_END=910 /DNA_ORIENTATION=-
MSIHKYILVDIAIAIAIAFGFVKFYAPINPSTPYDLSQQPNRFSTDQELELELNWERQHVEELQQHLGKVSKSQDALLQLKVRMERRLKEIEHKLEHEENALLKAQLQSLGRINPSKDSSKSEGGAVDNPSTSNLRGGVALRIGDVVQIRGTASSAPWKIQRHNEDETYDLIRATDGEGTSSVGQAFLSIYEPYDIGSEAHCNMGTYGSDHAEFVPCTILQYSSQLTKRSMVLQGKYEVRVYARDGEPEREILLPMWKVTKRP